MSSRAFVFVDQAAVQVAAIELRMRRCSQRRRVSVCLFGWAKGERAVRPMPVVMAGINTKDLLELAAAGDEQPIEALATHAADPTTIPSLSKT